MKSKQIVIKSGATDLRRQERKLIELAEKCFDGIEQNTLYAFSNKNNTAIKSASNSVTMIKVKRDTPYPWTEFKEKGERGYAVELSGKSKKKFLKTIGCPEDI